MVRWGILSTARMATERMLPAVAHSTHIAALASRDLEKARNAAARFEIPAAYGSYEEILEDPLVTAVYIPLPNHLHKTWAIQAARAGKHVLVEKPIGMNASEVAELIQVRDQTGVMIGEAFMVATHPRWLRAAELIRSGRLGELRMISGYFTIPMSDAANIRFDPSAGGGALFDLGCYQALTARTMFGEEPIGVAAFADLTSSGVDRTFSFLLQFPSGGQASFTCAFETTWAQRINLIGTKARMDVELPTSSPEAWSSTLVIDDGSDHFGKNAHIERFPPCNQYAVHLNAFEQAIEGRRDAPVPLEESLKNMKTLDALAQSARERRFVLL